MSLSRSVFRRAVDGDSRAARLARSAGLDASLIEQLESRVLLSADWSDAGSTGYATGPELQPGTAIEQIGWNGYSAVAKRDSWILSFGGEHTEDEVEQMARDALASLPQELLSISSLAKGQYASVTLSGSPSEFTFDAIVEANDDLTSVSPNRARQVTATPDDTLFSSQWHLDNTGQTSGGQVGVPGADINVTVAWEITTGTQDTIVAVVDTGIDFDHADLAGNIWTNPGEIPNNNIDDDGNGYVDDVHGWDFVNADNDPQDDQGHGTHVSGIIGASGNNDFGVSGVAWNVSIIPIKAGDEFGFFYEDAVVQANYYLTDMITDYGHNIVASNNSWGGFDSTFYEDAPNGFDAERDSIEAFLETGAAYIAAAGNDGFDIDHPDFTAFPAAYNIPGLISVAATDNQDSLAGFSNWGNKRVDLAAPGQSILSTIVGGSYANFSGTSMATPVVSGAVALLKAYRPDASATEIRQALIDSVDVLPTLQGKVVSGGRLNVGRALEIIGTDGPITTGFNPGPVTNRLDSDTGLPIDTLTVSFNKDIDASTLDETAALFTYAGADGEYDTADDDSTLVPVSGVSLASGETRVIEVALDLSGVPQQRLPLGKYRLMLYAGTSGAPKIQDTDGNLLNGDADEGTDETYDFEVIGVGGSLESNDTIATATPVAFDGSGNASFSSLTIGDGLQASLDVDMFKITLPKGGLITAGITAANLEIPSDLDSYLRLFDALGEELAVNDQFNGRDSALDYFVTTGGTYYIGVSGFPNYEYDPTTAGSGRSQSTGTYNIAFGYERIADDRLDVDADLDEPKAIPAEGTQGTMSDTITVTDARVLKDLNLRLDLDHTYVSDLEITLIGPDGTEAVLFDRHGDEGDDFEDVLLDDEATVSITDAATPYTGSLKPTNGLNTFDGHSALGDWTLLIRDYTALNSGQLNSWSLEFTLENDIFGEFEANDTFATARQLTEISGTGSASRGAVIGDGGFGTLDRDIFWFVAEAGSTLNATATSVGDDGEDPTLDTSLRLFDSSGTEIKSASPSGALDSSLTSFVFPAGGTYYIAVSEGVNTSYNPLDVTTGTPSVTTGSYQLDLTVSPGISDDATVFSGTSLTVGVGDDGTLGADDEDGDPYGASFDGADFLLQEGTGSSLESMYGLTAGGYDFMNTGGSTATALPVSLTNESGPGNFRVTGNGLFRDLEVERSVTVGSGDSFIVFDVLLTNTGSSDLSDVAWLEAFNPNQGLNLSSLSAMTSNDVDSAGKYASASVTTNQYPGGLTIALGAAASDDRAIATFYDPDSLIVRDPSQVVDLGVNDPGGATDDLMMALAYDIGTIEAGESTTLRYFVFFGESSDDAQALYDDVNAGTGEGHLASDSASPADETLSNGETAPTLSYRYYYPAGFSSDNIFSFVPMINANSQDTRVVVIAHYETGERDDLIADFTIEAGARGGITTNTPASYAVGFGNSGGSLVRPLEPYALEIRSERPIAATFSYFDTYLLDGEKAAVGESFTATTSNTWTFSSVAKFDGRFDFPVYLNTTDASIKVTTTLLPTGGGDAVVLTQELGAGRRGGWNLSAIDSLPDGEYGMVVEAEGAIVASLSSYDNGTTSGRISAMGTVGLAGRGATTGATPEGELGINSTEEIVGVTNASDDDAVVTFSFLFENGSAYRTAVDVESMSRSELDVSTLPGFPIGEPYSIVYSSTAPVAVSLPTLTFSDGAGTMFSDEAYTLWAFGAGFRPQDGHEDQVTEYLRVFNPSDEQIVVEITILFDGNFEGTDIPLGSETFRRTISARGLSEFDVQDFVTGDRRLQDTFYGITVKGASPIVAYLGRFDSYFPGAFGTLGVPLGLTSTI